jgi:hypothetical protein
VAAGEDVTQGVGRRIQFWYIKWAAFQEEDFLFNILNIREATW